MVTLDCHEIRPLRLSVQSRAGEYFPAKSGGKIFLLNPLTGRIFAVSFRRRKRGAGFNNPVPFPSAPFYGKTGSAGWAAIIGFCGASPAPRPPPKSKRAKGVVKWNVE